MAYPENIDENAARITAGLVFTLAAAALVLHAWWLLPLLFAGFVIRATVGPKFSPLALLAGRVVVPALKLKPQPTWATPKRFAQACGIVFTASASVLALGFHAELAAGGVLVVLLACAALESFFGFCVGCRVYDFVGPKYERAKLAFKR
ncbi:MAG: DUF4395 domain-containing protein [Myxococcaceae bacterium]